MNTQDQEKCGVVIATITLRVEALHPEEIEQRTRRQMRKLDDWLERHWPDFESHLCTMFDDAHYVVGMRMED